MSSFTFNTAASIRFGCGVLQHLGAIAGSLTAGRFMLVTDSGMMRTGIVERACETLTSEGVEFTLYNEVEADPPEDKVHQALALAAEEQVAGVIGLGGGSSLDVAKLVALLATGTQRLADVYGVGNAKGSRLPLILIPTTAGTGSEVTPISIVTTATNEKMGVVSPVLLPDVALLDPELTYGLPPHITAATGIDAIVHAVEAYASANSNNNVISRTLATRAVTLMVGSILAAVQDGTNRQARENMLLGSMLAGQAFANSPVAAVHALAYPLGGHFHIPHGLSNALVLPHVLRFNIATHPEAYAELAPFAFPQLAAIGEKERAEGFCEMLADLCKICGLQTQLRQINVPEEMLPKLASDAMRQTRLLVNNPRKVTEADALSIYRAAY